MGPPEEDLSGEGFAAEDSDPDSEGECHVVEIEGAPSFRSVNERLKKPGFWGEHPHGGE